MPAPSTDLPLLELPDVLRGLGVLEVSIQSGRMLLPLRSVDMAASVADRIASVTVKQVFGNTLNEHMEAVYIFPLAAGCTVSKFEMLVGERRVHGLVKERAEARQAYQQALSDGHRAAIMEQERDDVFTVQVGNLPAGEEVTIEITYSERLPYYESGKIELRLPMVVAPRYTPGQEIFDRAQTGVGVEADTKIVPDASRISPPRLVAGNPAGVKLSVSVDLAVEDELSEMECSQHAIRMQLKPGALRVSLNSAHERLNRDFVLRWRICSDSIKTSLLTFTAEDGQTYGALSLVPPIRSGYRSIARDILFLLDRSGSMAGVKIVSAVRACSILLRTLGPQDTFSIVAFDNVCDWMPQTNSGRNFIAADENGIEDGEKFLRSIVANGGTELAAALSSAMQACNARPSSGGRMASIVVITDGEVSNESQILKNIQCDLGDTRLFAVGVDTAVNAGLLKRMTSLGGGTASFVEPGIQLEEALASIGREIGHPLVSDLQVDGQGLSVVDRASISPSRIPDLFAERASIAFFKLHGNGPVSVTGRAVNGEMFHESVQPRATEISALAQLWAKAHIVDLEDQYRTAQFRDELKNRIIELSVHHCILTKFTAFVAVDSAEVVNEGGVNRQMVQPVEVPADWQVAQQQESCWSVPASTPASAPAQIVRGRQQMKSLDDKTIDLVFRKLGVKQDLCDAEDGFVASPCYSSLDAPAPDFGKSLPGRADCSSYGAPPVPGEPAPAPPAQPQSPSPLEAPRKATKSESDGDRRKSKSDGSSGLYGRSGAAGSYGSGVRAQVFEVIVRQAIAGAPWREVCAGPMQASNISPEEVEAELARRLGALGSRTGSDDLGRNSGSNLLPEEREPDTEQQTSPKGAHSPGGDSNGGAGWGSNSVREEAEPDTAQQAKCMESQSSAGGASESSRANSERARVLEVIVRQAIAGAPWREICAGPMQANNISAAEVEAEVARRMESRASSSQEKRGFFDKLVEIKDAIFGGGDKSGGPTLPAPVEQFLRTFEQAFQQVANGERPEPGILERHRQELIRFLAKSSLAAEIPTLQRFIRSQAVELIASVQDSHLSDDELRAFWASQWNSFRDSAREAREKLAPQPFWERSI